MQKRVAADLAARWPWLCKYPDELRVAAPILSAFARLDWGRDCAKVEVVVDSATGVSGGIASIAEAARQIAEVRDAMLFVHGETCGLKVWSDGECPCSYCSGKGTMQGRSCERCAGKGVR